MPQHSRTDLARLALRRIPGFADGADEARIIGLGGETNRVFRFDLGNEAYCLRLPGPGTDRYIDRSAEADNTRIVAAAGLAPDLIYMAPDGTMVTRFVAHATATSPDRFRQGTTAERAGRFLRRLHETAPEFNNYFVLGGYLRRYRADLEATEPQALTSLLGGLDRAEDAVEVLLATPVPIKPCHCDLQPGNLLDTGRRMWLVDWEFSGQNDPFWDLAYLSLEAGFDPAVERRFVEAYLGQAATASECARIAVYKVLADLLAVLWGLVQQARGASAPRRADALRARTMRFASAATDERFQGDVKTLRGPNGQAEALLRIVR